MRATIVTPRLQLRVPHEADAETIRAYHIRNAAHHARFVTVRDPEALSLDATLERIRAAQAQLRDDRSVRTYAFCAATGGAIGAVNLSEIVRGPFQAAYVGYDLDAEYEGRGYMTEALRAMVGFAFTDLNLHRLMANYIPWNRRSHRVLERLGFVVEGYAKAYLQVNGVWEDHVLTSLSNAAWSARSAD